MLKTKTEARKSDLHSSYIPSFAHTISPKFARTKLQNLPQVEKKRSDFVNKHLYLGTYLIVCNEIKCQTIVGMAVCVSLARSFPFRHSGWVDFALLFGE